MMCYKKRTSSRATNITFGLFQAARGRSQWERGSGIRYCREQRQCTSPYLDLLRARSLRQLDKDRRSSAVKPRPLAPKKCRRVGVFLFSIGVTSDSSGTYRQIQRSTGAGWVLSNQCSARRRSLNGAYYLEPRTLARSFRVAPIARRARISRSSETPGSPASILATRDWLDLIFLASSACESFLLWRRRLKFSLRRNFNSTKAASSGESSRKSVAEPTLQPAASSLLRFAASICPSPLFRQCVVLPETPPAIIDYAFGRLPGHLLENVGYDDCVPVNPVNDAPRLIPVHDAQFVTSSADVRHRP